MKKHSFTLALTLAAVAAGGAAAAPEFDVAKEDERAKLAALERDAKAGDDAAVYAMDEVFAKLARPAARGGPDVKNAPADLLLDEPPVPGSGGITMKSLRTHAFEVAKRLPAGIRKKLIEAQKEGQNTERQRGADDEALLIRRFPFAPDAAANAWRFAQRAFDEGDDLGAVSWDRLAAKLAGLQLQTQPPPFAAHARRASVLIRAGDLEGAEALLQRVESNHDAAPKLVATLRERIVRARVRREALAGRRPPEGLLPDLFASYQLNMAEAASTTPTVFAPPVAAHVGDLVLASDGSRLVGVDARTGELQGRLPAHDPKFSPPATGIPGLVAAHGDFVATSFFCEKFVLESRGGLGASGRSSKGDPDEADPSVRGGYFSLFAYDARGLRLLWWDGDTSGRGRPAGMDSLDDRGWQFFAGKHFVGRPAIDGKRVYVALASTLTESTLWVVALERRSGESGSLVLVPVWTTFLSLSTQPVTNQTQNLNVPTVNPRLSLDTEGRLFVQTDQDVLAALDVRTGGIDWLRRANEEDSSRAARARHGAGYRATSDPPVAFAGDDKRPSVLVAASPADERWLGLSCEDGSTLWRSDTWTQTRSGGFTPGRGEGPRVLALSSSVALGYGGQTFVAFDAFTGAVLVEPNKVRAVRLEDHERLVGSAAPAGPGLLLLPTDQGRMRKLAFREETKAARRVELTLGEDTHLQGTAPGAPIHLIALEGRLIATTPARVLVYTWIPRGE